MEYRIRPGIVLLRICDVDMLVAKREVWEECPHIRPLPKLWGLCWFMMEKGRTSNEVVGAFVRMFGHTENEEKERLRKIFEKLYEEGYLIPVEENK